MSRAPIDMLLDGVVFKCTICKAPMGTCDCWTKCQCGHSYRKGAKCQNIEHTCEEIARDLAAAVLVRIADKRIAPSTRRAIELAAYKAGLEWARMICTPPPKTALAKRRGEVQK